MVFLPSILGNCGLVPYMPCPFSQLPEKRDTTSEGKGSLYQSRSRLADLPLFTSKAIMDWSLEGRYLMLPSAPTNPRCAQYVICTKCHAG